MPLLVVPFVQCPIEALPWPFVRHGVVRSLRLQGITMLSAPRNRAHEFDQRLAYILRLHQF